MTILERDKDDFEDSIRTEAISIRFIIGSVIARGKFGVVKKLTDRASGVEYAGKFVKRGDVQREARLLHEVCCHNYIIGLESFYMTPKMEMVIVMELAVRGDIFEYCVGKTPFDEADARDITRQLTMALEFIHEKHIVHMDIKPQNILLSVDGKCRLADFGLSRKIPPGETVQEISGTPEYTAPEILDYSPITTAADIWSLGCVVYVMLTGLSPFAGDTLQETYLNVSQVNLCFSDDEWKNKSRNSISMIEKLCTRCPRDRLKAKEILKDKWFQSDFRQTSSIEEDKIEEMAPTIRRRSRRSRRVDESEKMIRNNQSGDSDSGVSVSDEDSFNSDKKSSTSTKPDFFKRRELRRKLYQLKMKSSVNSDESTTS